ncbi:MAG: hypothetical protein V4511_16105 [Bacteroidota bacterium]
MNKLIFEELKKRVQNYQIDPNTQLFHHFHQKKLNMSGNNFEKIMADHPDETLLNILKNRNDYQKEASDAAINEAIKRRLVSDLTDLQIKLPSSVKPVNTQFEEEKIITKEKAKRDMLFGALWCIGGIIATAAHIGFIFWGAIIFGGIQFFRGLINNEL